MTRYNIVCINPFKNNKEFNYKAVRVCFWGMIMRAYPLDYLSDVVEEQGKLFDYVAQSFPDCDTEDFILTYMVSKTRKSIDSGQAYVNTMSAKELCKYLKYRCSKVC